jgi:hypothetical protein
MSTAEGMRPLPPVGWQPGTVSEPKEVFTLCPRCGDAMQVAKDGRVRCDSGCTPQEIWDVTASLPREPGEDDGEADPLFLPVSEFFARCSEHVDFLLEPYVVKNGSTLILAAPKAGKTWFAAWIATKVAKAGHVVLLVEEEGAATILRQRLQPFVRDPATLDGRLFIAHRKGWRLDDDRSVNNLIAQAKSTHAQLVILDPLIQLHGQNENHPSEMAIVFRATERIIRETGCAVVVIHHTRKGESWDKSSGADLQSSESRGAGNAVGAADNVFMLRAVPPAERRPGEVRFFIENTDSRVSEPWPKRLAVVRPDARGSDDAMTFLDPASPLDSLLQQILPHIPEAPEVITAADLRDEAQVGKTRVQSAIDFGLRTGALVRVAGKGGGLQRGNGGLVRESPQRSETSRTADRALAEGPRSESGDTAGANWVSHA